MNPHLVVDFSSHGYGHATMTIPVLNALLRWQPKLKITIRTAVPPTLLADRLEGQFHYIYQSDIGMAMLDPTRVLVPDSLLAYRRLHASWKDEIADAVNNLTALRPSLLLSNIPYVSLAAARKVNIPAVALSSLNWADIFYFYCSSFPGATTIWERMAESYAAASVFLQPEPSMAMASIHNGRTIGPLAHVGRDRRTSLRRRLGLKMNDSLVLLSFGGIPRSFSFDQWPRFDGMCILTTSVDSVHPNVVSFRQVGFSFVDIIRSCDVIIGKPGYGLIVEAACAGVPMLLLPRDDWPEAPALLQWFHRNGRGAMLPEAKLVSGDFLTELSEVRAMRAPPLPNPSGVAEAFELLSSYFD